MVTLAIGKELAPIEDCNVKGVRVCANPELTRNAQRPVLPPGSIERNVSQTVTAKKSHAAHALRVFH
jgi:hypothetical protein